MAKKYFWRAENRYQSEMEAYEKNRTHRQYAQLLRAFEVLNADFHKSLNYFLRLYEKDPKPEYARFIGNIYLRFDDKSKARYYHSRADE
jgi:aminoglycoside/choline kinase family phosphotransferase